MSDPIQSIARHLGIQTFGDGLLAKIGQTIDLLQEAARNRADLAAECERLREETAVLVGEIAEIEVRRDAALAELAEWAPLMQRLGDENQRLRDELAALKGGREAVGGDLSACPIAYAVKGSDVMFGTAYEAYQYMGEGSEPFALYTAPPAQASAWVPFDLKDIHDALAAAHSAIVYQGKSTSYEYALGKVSKALHAVSLALPVTENKYHE